MKSCPTCKQAYDDETLKFCRADGTALINDSSSIESEAGTIQLGSSSSSEISTSILPHTTKAGVNRGTGPTTVLSPQVAPSTTGQLVRPGSKRKLLVVGASVLIVAVVAAGYVYISRRNSGAISSIAVMPFVNEGGNADVEYLSDGMTETLISSLSQLPKLNVKARSSVFRYKGKDTNAWTIGRELNVQAILMGRVVQRGEQLTLYLELVDAQTGNRIWGEQYNRKLKDLITLQSDIARDVSQKLKTKFLGPDEQPLAKNYTGNVEAYQLYLKE